MPEEDLNLVLGTCRAFALFLGSLVFTRFQLGNLSHHILSREIFSANTSAG